MGANPIVICQVVRWVYFYFVALFSAEGEEDKEMGAMNEEKSPLQGECVDMTQQRVRTSAA